jgi:DNA repair exonuclease SbcCD ATPase subunit
MRDTENKLDKKINYQESQIHSANSNFIELNSTVKSLAGSLRTFIASFEKHDENEMEKYDKIEETNRKIRKEIQEYKNSVDVVIKESIDQLKREEIKPLKETQRKAFKIFYVGSGVVMALGGIGGLIMWIVNLYSRLPENIKNGG